MADETDSPWEEREIAQAADDAGAIGGRVPDDGLDPAERPLAEAGEGVSEGFELAEEDLVNEAENLEAGVSPLRARLSDEAETPPSESGAADHELSSETPASDR